MDLDDARVVHLQYDTDFPLKSFKFLLSRHIRFWDYLHRVLSACVCVLAFFDKAERTFPERLAQVVLPDKWRKSGPIRHSKIRRPINWPLFWFLKQRFNFVIYLSIYLFFFLIYIFSLNYELEKHVISQKDELTSCYFQNLSLFLFSAVCAESYGYVN